MIQKKYVLAITFLIVLYFGVSPGLAVPAAPYTHILEGKDGSNFTAKLWGDEWSHGWETTEGYSIVFNETTKDWVYAIPNADGNLVSSKKVVGTDSPPIITKHLRPQGKSQNEILNLRASHAQTVSEKSVPAAGTANIPVILINFNDRSTTYTPADFNALLFGTGTKSMKDYFQEVSYGKFSVASGPSGVAGWYTASNNHDYYGFDYGGISGNDDWFGTLVREAIVAADPSFNYAPYDNDGDCYVDNVNIIHQGTGQEASGITTDIWSCSSNLNALYPYYSNGPEYTTNDACPSGGFIKVNAFVIQPETFPEALGGGQSTMGVFAHEFGHALGLPDLYDTTFASEGVGDWSLMASGNWLGISRAGDRPAHLDAWSKSVLGWVSPIQVSTSSATQIKRVEDNSIVFQLLDNPNGVSDWTRTTTGKGEYFLVENRQKTGFDAALPGEGLLIWHIDESIGNNNNYNHKLVDLEESDGLNNLDSGSNRGDAGDPWYNKIIGFTQATIPNSHFYNGSDSGVRVTNIGASGTTMEANLLVPGGSVAPVVNFTGAPTTGAAPLTVTFTDQSTNTPGTWNWTFGDGNVTNATDRNPVHTYIAHGTYDVSLNVTFAGGVSNVTKKSGYIVVTRFPTTKIGVYKNGIWYLDNNGNGAWDGSTIDKNFNFGGPGNVSVVGDWNGDNKTEIGVTNGVNWYLDDNGNGVWDGTGTDKDKYGYFGITGYTPIMGDWNGDIKTEIGVTNSVNWYLDDNGNGFWEGTAPGKDKYGYFGITGYTPIVGDWNGDMKTEIGVTNGVDWYLDDNGNGVWDGTGPGTDKYAYFGIPGYTPVVGDWNGDNKTEIGYTNSVSWYLDDNGNGVWDGTAPGKDKYGYFGITGYTPIMGDWNGDMKTEIGVTNSVNWYLDDNGNGVWDGTAPGKDKYGYFGITGWTPLVGKW